MTDALDTTLAKTLWPARRNTRLARGAALVVGGALALVVSAKIQVPFAPVPMTLQTLVVLILGAAYGARLAAASVALYLAEGLVGLPVFAGAIAGPAYMAGPTGGFLFGFLAAAALIGALAERGWGRSWPGLLATMTLGHAIIFAFGFAWLATLIGPEKAFALGVAPFALATLVKTLLACALVRAAWDGIERLRDA
jgi:biotin transport system substrate-specific component